MKLPTVYIMASQKNGPIYTGVTSNLVKRAYEHKESLLKGFTKTYGCKILVFYEVYDIMQTAILREKQIKLLSRKEKIELIEAMNPDWKDLYYDII